MVDDDLSASGECSPLGAPFARSLDPMFVCDDRRRFVDANAAACLFVRLPRRVILTHRIDDLLPPERRPALDAAWARMVRLADRSALNAPDHELALPDGARVAACLCAATVGVGRHLATIAFGPARELSAVAPRHRLTERERQVLSLVARGNTGAKIATQLFLAPTTVQTHVNNTLVKLEARNRVHAVAIALQTGEIDIDDPPGQRAISGFRRDEA
jgi:DNA-binding CsgD family transcriptional regulator